MPPQTLEPPKTRAIFLDRDGTLGGLGGFCHPDEFEFYDFTFKAIKLINQAGFKAVVITNQSRIAKGQITSSQVQNSIDRLNSSLEQNGAKLDAWFICPHQRIDNCNCKKPKPCLFLQAAQELEIDLQNSFMIGDHGENHMLAAVSIGCKPVLVLTGWGRGSNNEFRHTWDSIEPAFVAKNLLEAVKWILESEAKMLINLDELQTFLDQKYPEGLGIEREEICLVSPGLPDSEIENFEIQYGLRFPKNFREMIQKYQFQKLSLSHVNFGNSESYLLELSKINIQFEPQEDSYRWHDPKMPKNMLYICSSSFYVILLDCQTDEIFSIERDCNWEKAEKIAKHFEHFIRGIGTYMVGKLNNENLENLNFEIGSDSRSSFWKDFLLGAV
jgi:D,D-heptose 1,7-bisphosphate phosphatase